MRVMQRWSCWKGESGGCFMDVCGWLSWVRGSKGTFQREDPGVFFFVLEKIDERGYGCDWMEDNMGRERVREWRDERVQLGDKERDREEERMRGRERERGRHRVRGVLF